jgi:hypothetical protein
MNTQNFYKLSRITQDRLLETFEGRTVPQSILQSGVARPLPYRWAAGALASLVVFVVLVRWGYGRLDTSLALAPTGMIVAYGVALSAAVYCALQTAARWQEVMRVPFRHGKYVFPSGLIDASSADFSVRPISQLSGAEVSGGRAVTLRFDDGASYRFKTRDNVEAEKARERIIKAKRKYLEAELQGSDELWRIDPLLEPRFSNPLAPAAPHSAPIPTWRRLTPLYAVLVGAAVALLVGYVRNTLSERRMFATAVEANSPEAYRGYLDNGGKRPDVADLRLPAAELAALTATGSLAELEAYAASNRESKIKPQIDAALRVSLLAALEEAKKKESFTALAEFAAAHPALDLVQAEVKAARKALMKRVIDNYADNHSAPGDPELVPFFEKLLHYLADHGPRVEVRFHRIVPESVERADSTVRADKAYSSEMLPSRYFDDTHSETREKKIYENLEQQFREVFNPGALTLVRGKHLTSDEALPEQPTVPTLFITHSTNMGRGIGNLHPSGTFVGVGFLFKAYFVVPHEEQMLQTKYSTWRPPDLLKLRKAKITIPEVYLTMADTAFSTFDQRLGRWLFRSD